VAGFQALADKKIRITVKHILKKHGFPPDLQYEAIKTVVQQAEALAAEVSANSTSFAEE
jgi:hypothetical protein